MREKCLPGTEHSPSSNTSASYPATVPPEVTKTRAAQAQSFNSGLPFCRPDVFARTWEGFPRPDQLPDREFWADAIAAVRRPGFLFLAEAYWDLEARLQSLGFDFTYDKRLLEFLVERRPAELWRHLLGRGTAFVSRCAHFLENHDEPRIASLRERIPGARLDGADAENRSFRR